MVMLKILVSLGKVPIKLPLNEIPARQKAGITEYQHGRIPHGRMQLNIQNGNVGSEYEH